MSFIFDYRTFYNFYSQNLKLLPQIELSFYSVPDKYTGAYKLTTIKCFQGYQFSDGLYVYITYSLDESMNYFFYVYIPKRQLPSGAFLADHFTFGIKNHKTGLIDMHFTLQRQNTHSVDHSKCFLTNGQQITLVKDIVCTVPKNTPIGNVYHPNELSVLEKLLTEPFIQNKHRRGGRTKEGLTYESMNLAELKQRCKECGIKGYSSLCKAELIAALRKRKAMDKF